MYKAIIFDLDGVLIETENIHIIAISKAFAENGCVLDSADIKYLVARAPREYVPLLLKKHNWNESINEQILTRFREIFHTLWDAQVELKPGVKKLFEELKKKNIQINLATNSSKKTAEKFISKFGLVDYFSQITAGDEVVKRKPDPEIYIRTKEKLDINNSEVLVVEDSMVGLLAAKAAGLNTAIIPNDYTRDQDFTKANYIFESITEIIKLFP